MDTKKCFKCKVEWPLIYFYKHKQMGDGHLNKCKSCTKKDVAEHREKNIEAIKTYEVKRNQRPERKKHLTANTKKWRLNNPVKWKAQQAVSNAIRNGRIKKLPCCVCGDNRTHAHHEDYSKTLDIIWLCPQHHSGVHK